MILYTGKISTDTVDDYWEGSFEMCGNIGKIKDVKDTTNDKATKCKRAYKASMRKKQNLVKNNKTANNKTANNKSSTRLKKHMRD